MIKTCVYIYIHIKQWINHTLQVDLDPENLRVVKEDRLGVFVCRIHVRLRGGECNTVRSFKVQKTCRVCTNWSYRSIGSFCS